jgi:hypothetical protein
VGALHLYPDRVAITAGRYKATHTRIVQKRTPAAVFGWKALSAATAASRTDGAPPLPRSAPTAQ